MQFGKISGAKLWLILFQVLWLGTALKKIQLELRAVDMMIEEPGNATFIQFNHSEYIAISEGKTIVLWDIEKDSAEKVVQIDREVALLTARPGSSKIFATDKQGGLIVHDFESNKRVMDLKGIGESEIPEIKFFLEDENNFIMNYRGKHLLNCSLQKGCEKAWPLEKEKYVHVEISKNSKTIFVATSRNIIRLIETEAELDSSNSAAKEIAFSAEILDFIQKQQRLFVLLSNGQVKESNLLSLGEMRTIYKEGRNLMKFVEGEGEPNTLLIRTRENNIMKLSLTSKQVLNFTNDLPNGPVAFNGSSRLLLGLSLWNPETGELEKALTVRKKIEATRELFFKYDSNDLIFISKANRLLNVRSLRKVPSKYKYEKLHEVQCFDYNYNINLFYILTTEGKLFRYQEKWLNEELLEFKAKRDAYSIHIIDFERFVIVYKDRSMVVYEDLKKIAELSVNKLPVLCLRDLNGNRMLLIEKNYAIIFSFETRTMELFHTFLGEATTSLYDETEGTLLVGTQDGNVHVLSFSIFEYTMEANYTIKVSEESVLSLSFTRTPGQVAVITADGFFKIYEFNTRKLLAQKNLQGIHSIENLKLVGYSLVEKHFIIAENDAKLITFWVIDEQMCLVIGCEDCYEDHTKCQKCDKGKFLAQPVYRRPGFFSACESCTGPDEFIQTVNERKVCVKCNTRIKDCEHCKGEPLLCSKCAPNKYLLARNRSFFECVDCNSSSLFKLEPVVEDGTGLCRQCKESIKGCETCTEGGKICLKCEVNMGLSPRTVNNDRYSECEQCNGRHQVLDETSGVCFPCENFIKNCEFCYGKKNDCQRCKSGFYYYNGKDETLKNKCIKCDDDTKIIKGNMCKDCSQVYDYCKGCEEKDGCLECQPGFFLQLYKQEGIRKCSKCDEPGLIPDKTTNMCVPCYEILPGCSRCSSSPLTCHRCQDGFFLLLDKTGINSCTRCNLPSLRVSTNSKGDKLCEFCSEKLPDCEECDSSGCKKCAVGEKIYLENGVCLKRAFNNKEKIYISFSFTISALLLGSYIIYRKKHPLKKNKKTQINKNKDQGPSKPEVINSNSKIPKNTGENQQSKCTIQEKPGEQSLSEVAKAPKKGEPGGSSKTLEWEAITKLLKGEIIKENKEIQPQLEYAQLSKIESVLNAHNIKDLEHRNIAQKEPATMDSAKSDKKQTEPKHPVPKGSEKMEPDPKGLEKNGLIKQKVGEPKSNDEKGRMHKAVEKTTPGQYKMKKAENKKK